MINDLVERLQAEADAEAGQKQFCDTNMAEATSDRDEAQREVERLNALKTEKAALSDSLTESIGDYAQQIADLQKAMNEATTLRDKEHLENEKTVTQATAGKAAVSNAIEVLENFYGTGFVQISAKKQPA